MNRLRAIEREGLKTNLPAFDPGDTVRVMVRVREGDKERLQAFEGVCIGRRGAGINATFTVRKIWRGGGGSGSSRCIRRRAARWSWSARAACVAPSWTSCGGRGDGRRGPGRELDAWAARRA